MKRSERSTGSEIRINRNELIIHEMNRILETKEAMNIVLYKKGDHSVYAGCSCIIA